MLSLRVFNISGTGSLALSQDLSGVAIQIDTTDADNATVSVLFPIIAMPQEPLMDAVRAVIRGLIPGINTYLSRHPFPLPDGLSPMVPNPEISFVRQPGCCKDHGYVEIASSCS